MTSGARGCRSRARRRAPPPDPGLVAENGSGEETDMVSMVCVGHVRKVGGAGLRRRAAYSPRRLAMISTMIWLLPA